MVSISTAAQAQLQAQNLQKLLAEAGVLQTQTATGKKTNNFAGLGNDAVVSQRDRANLGSLINYDTNITNGQTRLNIMGSAVSQIQKEARSVSAAMASELQDGNFDMTALKGIASNALAFIKNLLNQTDGNTYVFGGSASATPPLTDNGTLDTAMQIALQQWTTGAITTAQFTASYTSTAQLPDTTIGYSAALSSGQTQPVAIKADDHASIDYTVLANDPAFRDIVAAIATIQSMTGTLSQVSGNPGSPTEPPGATAADQRTNFFQVFNDLITKINASATSIDQISSKIGYAQASLKSIQEDHTLDANVLRTTISNIEDVDMNEVAVKLSSLQTQLQASYQITASLQKFNLAFFLS
jgi:flagellar hook-associated protein 3 FlgL